MIRSILTVILLVSISVSYGQTPQKKEAAKKTEQSKTVQSQKNNANRVMPVKQGAVISEWVKPAGTLKFFELPYAYTALEPSIDAKTVELHYDKHHRGYYTNFMNAIKGTDLEKIPITRIFSSMSSQSETIRNNAGGYFNHVLYWQNMSPNGGGEPSGELADAINKTFGDFKTFVEKMTEIGKARFGSGWAWLAVDIESGELFITSTANQDNPLMDIAERRGIPILALDVWEHAYYLNYQNKRADYIAAFWKKVNWPDVEAKYKAYREMKIELKKH